MTDVQTRTDNALPAEEPRPGWLRFLEQYRSYMQIILVAAAIVSLLIAEWGTAVLLLVLTVLNAVIGLRQEGKAESAMNALKSMMKATARVRRQAAAPVPAGTRQIRVVLASEGPDAFSSAIADDAVSVSVEVSVTRMRRVPTGTDDVAVRRSSVVRLRRSAAVTGPIAKPAPILAVPTRSGSLPVLRSVNACGPEPRSATTGAPPSASERLKGRSVASRSERYIRARNVVLPEPGPPSATTLIAVDSPFSMGLLRS